MDQIAYTVIAETDSKATADRFVDWLVKGHIADVVKAGALSGQLVSMEQDSPNQHRLEVRYVFGSRGEFDAYESGPAVALRAEGVVLFGPESPSPISFQRTIGRVVAYTTGA